MNLPDITHWGKSSRIQRESLSGVQTKTTHNTKAKGKNGGKGPQPGDVGFFNLGLMNTPQNFNDGSKIISVKYDYCSFNSGRFDVQ